MTTICSACGLNLTERETDDKYVLCPHCNRFIPKGASSFVGRVRKLRGKRARINDLKEYDNLMKGGGTNMVEKKEKSARTLTCSRCGKVVHRGKKGMERWTGKKYLCRECRKLVSLEEKKKRKEKKK